jgi:hypothetical protein
LERVGVAELGDVAVVVGETAVVVRVGDGVRVDVAVAVAVFGTLVGEAVLDGVIVGGKEIGVSGTAVTVSRSSASSRLEPAAMVGSSGANSKL